MSSRSVTPSDYIVEGQQAPDVQAAALFQPHGHCTDKLRPLPLAAHNLTEADAADPAAPDGFRADDRLAKTLLPPAVALKVPAPANSPAGWPRSITARSGPRYRATSRRLSSARYESGPAKCRRSMSAVSPAAR